MSVTQNATIIGHKHNNITSKKGIVFNNAFKLVFVLVFWLVNLVRTGVWKYNRFVIFSNSLNVVSIAPPGTTHTNFARLNRFSL